MLNSTVMAQSAVSDHFLKSAFKWYWFLKFLPPLQYTVSEFYGARCILKLDYEIQQYNLFSETAKHRTWSQQVFIEIIHSAERNGPLADKTKTSTGKQAFYFVSFVVIWFNSVLTGAKCLLSIVEKWLPMWMCCSSVQGFMYMQRGYKLNYIL